MNWCPYSFVVWLAVYWSEFRLSIGFQYIWAVVGKKKQGLWFRSTVITKTLHCTKVRKQHPLDYKCFYFNCLAIWSLQETETIAPISEPGNLIWLKECCPRFKTQFSSRNTAVVPFLFCSKDLVVPCHLFYTPIVICRYH